jgi:hypothetical protein
MKILRALAGCAALTFLYCSSLNAGTFNAFGPQTYVRNTATPVTLTNSFSILNPNTQYTLNIQNSGAASAVIAINGTQILGPGDFSDATAINRPVTLRLNNTIAVQLRSASGTSLKVTIIGVDNDLPVITASAAPTADTFGWNNMNVVVKFTCSDKTSGVAFCPPAVTVSTEAANQVITGTAADRAGNTASASVTLNIDKTVPVISAVAVPPANTFGWNNATAVTVTFNCLDPLSGIATCTPPAILNAEGANQIAAGTAVDKAGNMASASAIINIDRTPPTIAAQATPAPNAAGWNNTGVNVAFTCADSLSGIASCPPPATVNSEGANQSISGTALDKAGNSASAAVVLNIDETRPTVTATPVPAANSAGWNNSNVTINFNCSDTLSGVDFCPTQTIATTEGANQVFSGPARDRAGNTSTASAALNIDKTPPSLKITAPLSGATVIVPTVTLEGLVTDTLSGVAGVTCNGTPAQVSGSALTCGVPLSVGLNMISVVATDAAGNATTSSLTINFSATPTISITSPLNLSVVNATPVVVTGTVSDPNATVNVNGTAVPLTSGNFSVPIILKEGGNTITVVAQSAGGTPATATISVSLDTTPPHVTIDSPADGTITTASTIAVSGMINDIVPGTVNAQQATVTVNGMPAQVLNRNYLLHAVPLSPGPNTITALGTDLAGNTASVSITVVQKAVISQPTINLVSGAGQTGTIGTPVASPLMVQLKDGTGNPVAGQPVVFKVTGSNGTLSGVAIAGSNGGPTLVVNSDANGMAQVTWTLGMRAGAGNNTVKATATNFVGEVNFGAITLPATPGLISVDSGNNQFGAVGQPLPHPFVLVVTDPGHNRLPNIPVTFTVQQGGGFFTSQGSQVPLPGQTNFTSIIVKTDSDGRAMAILTLGQQEGIQNNLVEANFAGNQGFPATFTASGRVAGDPAATSISGVALDNTNIPIAGVTIQVENTALTTQSDQQGQFLLTGVPVGRVKLIADGATAARPGTWPKLEYELVTVSGTNNTLGMPVYLLPLDLPHGLQVDDTHGGTLTLPDVPGFSLTIAPGSVTFPDGGKSGLVSVTVVHADKVPMTPNFGQQPRFIVSIQPAGAHFNPPAPMTIPNVDGLTPGEVTEMYSFDHDLGSFVAIGTGTVSKDGSVIKSDPGVGIIKGGWHCGGNPNPGGTAATCGPCASCNGNICVPNSNQGRPCLNPCVTSGVGACTGGQCTGSNLPAGTSCNGAGVCDGQGNCTFPNCSVTCNSGNPCIIDLCFNNQCNPTPNPQCQQACNGQANGSSCSVGGFSGSCANGQCNTCPSLPNGTACMITGNQPGTCSGGQCQPNPCAGQANGTACSVAGAAGVCLSSQCAIQGCRGQNTNTPCNAGGSVPGNCTPDSQGVLQCTGSANQCPSSCNGGSCANGNCQNLSCQNGAGPLTGCPDCNTCQGGTCVVDGSLLGAPCTSPDKCSFGQCGLAFGSPPTGQCINLYPKPCDDQNICTDDSCTPGPGTCNNILKPQSDLDLINVMVQVTSDFATLSNQCPKRTQSNVLYDVDGCSTAGLTFGTNVQNPMVQVWLPAHPGQSLLNVGGNSTAFGADQSTSLLTSASQAFDLPCNQHDICYQTCHKGDLTLARAQCDSQLLSDAQRVCNRAYPPACPYDFITCNKVGGYFDQRAQCLSYATDYYDVVRAVGNLAAFKSRQTTYCQCCP